MVQSVCNHRVHVWVKRSPRTTSADITEAALHISRLEMFSWWSWCIVYLCMSHAGWCFLLLTNFKHNCFFHSCIFSTHVERQWINAFWLVFFCCALVIIRILFAIQALCLFVNIILMSKTHSPLPSSHHHSIVRFFLPCGDLLSLVLAPGWWHILKIYNMILYANIFIHMCPLLIITQWSVSSSPVVIFSHWFLLPGDDKQ